jgi:hypothetical protein
MIELNEFERVTAATPDTPSGPGWSNKLIWVFIEDRRDGKIRLEAIQQEDFSREIDVLFNTCYHANKQLIHEVTSVIYDL